MSLYRLVLKSGINGDDSMRNVFTVDSDQPDPPDAPDVQGYLDTVYTSDVLGFVSSNWQSTGVAIESPTGTGQWQYVAETQLIYAGTSAGEMLPRQSAPVIVGITASRRRGKKFICGVIEGGQNGGLLDTVLQTHLVVAAQGYITTYAGTSTLVPGVCKPDGTDFLAFNSFRVDAILGTQRRRKQGVGA